MSGIGGNKWSMRISGVVMACGGLALVVLGVYRMTHLHRNEHAADAMAYSMLPLTGLAAIGGGVSMFTSASDPAPKPKRPDGG